MPTIQLHHRKQAAQDRSDISCVVAGHADDNQDADGSNGNTSMKSNQGAIMIPPKRRLSHREGLIWAAVAVHIVILAYLVAVPTHGAIPERPSEASASVDLPVFHGGNPSDNVYGSCFQGADGYAMCNPFLSVGVVFVDDQQQDSTDGNVWLYRYLHQQDNHDSSIGILQDSVRTGESAEAALHRLVVHSADIDIKTLPVGRGPLLLGVYSNPPKLNIGSGSRVKQQQQRHIVRAVYIVRISEALIQSKSDTFIKVPARRENQQKPPFDITEEDANVLSDYRGAILRSGGSWDDATSERRPMNKEEIGSNVARSLC